MVSITGAPIPLVFRQWTGRIYLEDPADPAAARVAFILAKALPTPAQLEPLARLDEGCLVDFPAMADPGALLAQATAWSDAHPTTRLAIFSAGNVPISSVDGRLNKPVVQGVIWFGNDDWNAGPVTGNGKWQIKLAGSRLTATGDGLRFDLTNSDAGFYVNDDDQAAPPAAEQYVDYTVRGARRGLVTAPVLLERTLLKALNVGITYFRSTGPDYNLFHYPFYDPADEKERAFRLELDCGDPYPEKSTVRSRLIPPGDELRTGFNEVHGRSIGLAPDTSASLPGCFMLAPAPRRIVGGVVRNMTHQFIPAGRFLAGVGGGAKGVRLSLGTSNLETIALETVPGGVQLSFAQGPALVRAGEFDSATTLFKTAWLDPATAAAKPTRLALDPESMPLFEGAGATAFSPTTLSLGQGNLVPVAPVLGLKAKAGEIAFDREHLTRARRASLAARRLARLVPQAPPEQLRTPQGYLATRGAEGLTDLVFTRTSARDPGNRAGNERPDFGLVPTSDEGAAILADLAARNKIFLVTRFDRLLRYFKAESLRRLYMADWRVEPALAGDDANFVILKHDARPVHVDGGQGLIDQPSQWTHVDGLDLADEELAKLRALLASAVTEAKTNDLFRPFARRMTEAEWAGIACVNLVLSEMPPQLGALESLTKTLGVHHIGVDLTAIEDSNKVEWRPAMFGLINQTEAGDFLPAGASKFPLQLQLASLKLLVENDAVRTFECLINGRPIQIFETDLKKGSADFELRGRYQSRITPDGQRQDSYTFEVTREFRFDFDDDFVLESVVITRAGLVTLIDPTDRSKKRGRILFDGWLKFRKIGSVDLLGIDRLEFFDLGVLFGPKLNFDLRFELPGLHFNLEAVNLLKGVGSGSFLRKMPFRLSGFRIGDFSLPKLGYFDFGGIDGIPVRSDFRLGLDFNLDLGSLGSLGKKLERFKLNFLVGWVPKLKSLALGFRIDTGAGGGGLDLGVEGIVQLTADHFHFGQSADKKSLCLAADNARLKIFSASIPEDAGTKFSLYLLADPSKPDSLVEKIGWYGVYRKDDASGDAVAIRHLALGQRIEIKPPIGKTPLQDIRTTRDVLQAIDQLQTFASDQEFVKFATQTLGYAPQRDWFVALAGKFFKLAEIQLLLRDPDMYGIYVKLDAYEKFFIDLLYQKLADGVGRYSGELDIREFLPQLDFGAFSVTMGVIGFEVYTDGGFLIDLGFPKHVDYSRSFVGQAGIFMGKGGLYVGRTPSAAIPQFSGVPAGDAFRFGIALRLGLGREFTKGPLYASLSVSVFARIEGAVAQTHQLTTGNREFLDGIVFYLQGEVGIILEIEGRVDLRLVQARVLVRAWIAAGLTLASKGPIILHAEAGVDVRVRVVIGRIRIFRKTITISVTLSYSVRLRYEWELKSGPQMRLLNASLPKGWCIPGASTLVNAPLTIKLAVDISRRGTGDVVMIPMATVLKEATGDPHPLAGLATSLVRWAAECELGDPDPVLERFSNAGLAPSLDRLAAKIRTFADLGDAELDAALSAVLGGSTIALFTTDAEHPNADLEGYSIPLPPMLALEIDGQINDLETLPAVAQSEVDAIAAGLASQFARQSSASHLALAIDQSRPLAAHLFRDWLEALALNSVDSMQNAWTTSKSDPTYEQVKMSALLDAVPWTQVAGRSGRYLFGGIRVPETAPGVTRSLLDKAGLLFPVPNADFKLVLNPQKRKWLEIRAGTLTVDGVLANSLGGAEPLIASQRGTASAFRRVAKRFDLPDFEPLAGASANRKVVRFTEALRAQLLVEPEPAVPAHLSRLGLYARPTADDAAAAPDPLDCKFAALSSFSVRLAAKAPGTGAVIEVQAASEAERRPLDALFPNGDAHPALASAEVALAVRDGNGNLSVFQMTAGLAVARGTTVRERQPGDVAFVERSTDTLFYATAGEPAKFVELLRRAAIVNAAGTYLLVDTITDEVRKLIEAPDAAISLLLIFPQKVAATVPPGAVNSALFEADLTGKRLLAMASDAAVAGKRDELFETMALREPGSALIRLWRKPPADPTTAAGTTPEAHLDALFDMLEFGVIGDGDEMPADISIPLGSEFVSRTDPGSYTAEQYADFDLPAGWSAGLKYDLLIPLYRWAKHPDATVLPLNPYNALLQQHYTINYGWRDVFGNRLGRLESLDVVPHYEDPLEHIGAWPGIAVMFTAGLSPGEFQVSLSAFATSKISDEERAARLLKIIHQLEAPHVEAKLESSFGAVATPAKLAGKLAQALRDLRDGKSVKPWSIKISPTGKLKHAPVDLRMTIERVGGCAPDCPSDAKSTTFTLPLMPRDAVVTDEGLPTALAREFRKIFPTYMLARGVGDDGSSTWWGVDSRVLPKRATRPADVIAQPPLALAPLPAREVRYATFEDNGGTWSEVTRTSDVPAVDSDAFFGDFLSRLEQFTGPAMAPFVTRQVDAFQAAMTAKYRLLWSGVGDGSPNLFDWVRGIDLKGPPKSSPAADSARRMLRQACGIDLRAFYDVTAVAVQPMQFASGLPSDWFGTGESAPKLHGKIRLGASDAGLRTMTYGIPMSRDAALSLAVFRAPDTGSEVTFKEKIRFEVTHIEREVESVVGGAAASPAASRWLSVIPFAGEDDRRLIEVTDKALTVAAPLRQIPAAPVLSAPAAHRSDVPPATTGYSDVIGSICRWQYSFNLSGLVADGDEACCRLIYNVDPGAGEIIDTRSAANPLFETLAPQLARCSLALTGIWKILAMPDHALFGRACTLFAELATAVADAIGQSPKLRAAGRPRAEDRFIVKRARTNRMLFRFADHIDNISPFPVQLDKPRVGIGDVAWKRVSDVDTAFDLSGPHDGRDLSLRVDGLRVERLQSVWAAASIRRNAGMHPQFTYRTEELFLQEPIVPYMLERDTIVLDRTTSETLEARLEAAVTPLFPDLSKKAGSAVPGSPAQLRLAVEPLRLFDLLAESATSPEPDPKAQLIVDGSQPASKIASDLASIFLGRLRNEALGLPADARLILSVLMLTENRQAMVDLRRIAISLMGLKFDQNLADEDVMDVGGDVE